MSNVRHYFVDEAGDTTLFGRYGKPLVGTTGTSRYFMVGRLEVGDFAALDAGRRRGRWRSRRRGRSAPGPDAVRFR